MFSPIRLRHAFFVILQFCLCPKCIAYAPIHLRHTFVAILYFWVIPKPYTCMFASIHLETHYFCYFVVLATAKAVMLKCLDLFILGILLFSYVTYSQAVMFLPFDIYFFLFLHI